jgi:galactose mutarotase-like enzyme
LIPTGVDLLAGPASSVRLLDAAAKTGIELELTAPLDLAVVWSDPPRPMVCLEPWTAPRGSLVTGDRRLSLNPGESMRFHCRYNLISA